MGDRRRLAGLVLGAASVLVAGLAARAGAQPGPGSGSGSGSDNGSDIEMEPEPVGSGSGSGSATPPPATGSATEAPPDKDPKLAKKLVTAAQVFVQKGDYFAHTNKPDDAKAQYTQAANAYQKAIENNDDVSLYFTLALVDEKLGNLPDAYHHCKRVIAAPNMKPDVVKKAQAKLDELSMKVGTVALTIKPDGTAVSLGGAQVGEAPMVEPLVLMPGTYTLSLSAVGFQPKDAEVKVEAGSESERKIELDPVPVVVTPHVIEPEPETPGATPPTLLPVYIAGGATLGLVVIATITGISAVKEHTAYVAPNTSAADRADASSHGRSLAHATDLCLVGALGAAAFGGYWYWYKYRKHQGESTSEPARNVPKVDVIPWVQPNAGGFVAAGSF